MNVVAKAQLAQVRVDICQNALAAALPFGDHNAIQLDLNRARLDLVDKLRDAHALFPPFVHKLTDQAPKPAQCHCGRFTVPHWVHSF